MDRKEFLKTLRKELSFLSKEELEKEVLFYINEIDKSELSDVEVIKKLGSMDKIVKDVCKKHGLDYKIIKKESSNKIKDFYNDLVDLSTILKNGDAKKRTKIILDILLLCVITCMLKIPFIFIRDLGDRLIETILNSNLTVLAIWGLIIEIIYVVVAFVFFIRTFKKWYKDLK